MNQKPYSAYRGRKSTGRRVLTVLAVVLVILLVLGVAAVLILPNYVIYTDQGPMLPIFGGKATPTPVPAAQQPLPSQEPVVVVETPAPTAAPEPSPSPSAAPRPEEVDLTQFTRRDMPMGLVTVTGNGPREQDGSIFDQPAAPLEEGAAERNRALLYAAAYVNPETDLTAEELVAWCMADAAGGYDEIILADTLTLAGDRAGADLAELFRTLRSTLDEGGYQGRLSLVLDQSLFGGEYDPDLIPAVAGSFDRLYFRSTLRSANRDRLTAGGFTASGYTLVTVLASLAELNYAWAVLP